MALHLIAFAGSVSPNTDTELPVVSDTVITQPSATRIRIPADLNTIDFAYAGSTNLLKAEFQAPSLEVRRMNLRIIPHNRGQIPAFPSNAMYDVPPADVSFVVTEDLSVIVRQGGAEAENVVVLLQLKTAGARPAVPTGDVRLLRATGSETLAPFKWTRVTPIFDKALEPGEYAVIGFIPISAGMIAARLIFPGAVYRPGTLGFAVDEYGALTHDADFIPLYRDFEYGRFTHINPCMIECLSQSADTTQVFYFYVVKTA
jgi:hypothetical protein